MYDEMQKKLREGQAILEEASEEDRDRLGRALIKLHGALADFILLELSQRAPHLGLEVKDASRISWQELIRYGQQYLGFSESEARLISDADRQEQHIARGGTYAKSRGELVQYAEFVERWCATGEALQKTIHPEQAAPPAAGQIPGLPALSGGPQGRRPWYESTLLLIAYFAAFTVCFCIIGFLSYSETFLDYVRKTFERPTPQLVTTATPPALPSPTLALANTKAACIIIWVEHSADNLGRKSRARVYEELVSDQVKDAGMTPRKFYDQVVEHNPVLVEDGYEFKTGKTYLLPQCQ